MADRIDLLSLPLGQIQEMMAKGAWGDNVPAYRAKQLFEWLHAKYVATFDEMTNLPKDFRGQLYTRYDIGQPVAEKVLASRYDDTKKFLFRLWDGHKIESVLMKYSYGYSVCVSSQVGCRMGCRFCASTLDGLARNLTPGEMLGQVYAVQRALEAEGAGGAGHAAASGETAAGTPDVTDGSRSGTPVGETTRKGNAAPGGKQSGKRDGAGSGSAGKADSAGSGSAGKADSAGPRPEVKAEGKAEGKAPRVSRVVVMGCGEPLDNIENLIVFLRLLTDAEGFNMGQRSVTVSTCGLPDGIDRLAAEKLQITLALSLHAPDDGLRRKLMPVAAAHPLDKTLAACKRYFQATGRRVTYEYSLMKGVNDAPAQAMALAKLLKPYGGHVNLIMHNPVKEREFDRPDKAKAQRFAQLLEKEGVAVSLRREMGQDVNAACGQLRRDSGG
ncbi:MAG: radical SAM protein [Lachnospiraceae bacterium]|jgi:23S rRNA (adenine2503-C2)-methyltransferase|nr:radical SAM protein [Lachnospiraceae bacterium]